MRPARALRRLIHELGELGLDEWRDFRSHDGLGRRGRDLRQRASRCDGAVFLEQPIRIAGLGIGIPVLDQQPIGPFPAITFAAHPDQDPAASQACTLQREFKIAAVECLLRRSAALGNPITSVPQLNRAAAVLSTGNRALEISIVQRMIFDFDCQALIRRIERRTLGDGPGLEHSIELQPQVVVQAPRRVLLYDEP